NAIQAYGYGMDDTPIKNVTVSEPSVTSKARSEWMEGIPENPNPNPSSFPPISKERNSGLALGEDRYPCLHANVLALLPSPALALILARQVL
ncbi:hypothetical protein CHARACLAT_015047, partial [Characodon lateralis]|nr:hypothetical protein [Characodon lateralis]